MTAGPHHRDRSAGWVPVALTIAGSDSSGGAGIQADLKTFTALGVYGASVLTALTAQNTTGVRGVHLVPAAFVRAQLSAVFDDLAVGAVKTGMLATAEIVAAVADELSRRPDVAVVVDPVMVATSGDRLLDPDAVTAVVRHLLPLAVLVTPNLAEAAVLLDQPMATSLPTMERQAEALMAQGCRAVLVKGGHATGPDATDVLAIRAPDNSIGVTRLSAPRVETANTHGTGCTLSAAIAAHLACGAALPDAARLAKAFLTDALRSGRDHHIGRGNGPVDHMFAIARSSRTG